MISHTSLSLDVLMWEDLKSPAFKDGLIFLGTFGLSPEGAPEIKLEITLIGEYCKKYFKGVGIFFR